MLPTLRPGIGQFAADRFYSQNGHLPWQSDETSVFTNASPSVANEDMASCTVTSPGAFEVDLTPTGILVIDTAGSTTRESFYCNVYDNSLRKWYGDTIMWVNNALPVYSGGSVTTSITEDVLITPVSIAAHTTDAENDVLTYTVVGGSLPPGLTLDPATGIITGTPTA